MLERCCSRWRESSTIGGGKGREAAALRALGESWPMLVRVSGSWELMEPTGSMANFSWNHLSGLANLSLTPWFPPFPLISPPSPRFIPPSLTAPVCPHSVKVPGGDRRNRRVFCAQLTQSAQSIYNLPFKRWGFFDPTPWTRNQFTCTLFVLIFFTMQQSCNCVSHNVQPEHK